MKILVELMVCFSHWHDEESRGTIHNQSFPFHTEAYSMRAYNSGMYDSMDEELESCFKGWA